MEWLMRTLGDVYPYKAVRSHARRLLGEEFTYASFADMAAHFRARMLKAGRGVHELAIARSAGWQRLEWLGQRAVAMLPGGGEAERRAGAEPMGL